MALNINQEVSDIENIGIVRDKRGEIIRLTFDNPVNVDLCIHDGNDLNYITSLTDVDQIASWSSHINVYDAHNKKPVLKSSFMKARKAKSPDKMRATAEITCVDNSIRITIEKNQYKLKKKIKPFSIEE